ncbi:MAG: L,D-transpeptidase [Nocardioides sp.]
MSRHRAGPPPRVRPRYGRIAVLGVSVVTTAVGLLGGVGVLPSVAGADPRVEQAREQAVDPVVAPVTTDVQDDLRKGLAVLNETMVEPPATKPEVRRVATAPDQTGSGRRVVFSQTEQRVWLVEDDDQVRRSYRVSGSLTDNLGPGTYQVYSRSENAVGIDDSGTMQWFVRFTQGPSGAAIGFHSIPIDDGAPVQSKSQLGTPQSHGCIRQKMIDAKSLWEFAPIGTTVVVV